ncbi:MAG: AAA family ATPase [Solirubrobacteraceae bacterium]
MRVTSLKVTNFRSIVEMPQIDLGRINVFVGPNNAGKSSLIRALYSIQHGAGDLRLDVRVGASEAKIEIGLEELDVNGWANTQSHSSAMLTTTIGESAIRALRGEGGAPAGVWRVEPFSNREPKHLIVPYLAKRKAMSYNEDVRLEHALSVGPQLNYLAAKLSRLGNSSFPGHDRYVETCRQILGFVVSAVPSDNGQRPGVFVDGTETIPIDQMGEGVPNIVALLAELALAKGKLFLLEEPENDLHPQALKALLDFVVESAKDNQFVVSTHSNIVVRHLGAVEGSLLYSVDAERGTLPPVAKVAAVPPTAEARLALLRDLGYSFSDFDLWEGWLILEESSAERIIRDYLVPNFAPMLTRVRTVSAGGNSEVTTTFEDFNRLVRFTHLEDAYRDRAWVIVDGDQEGQKIVQRLRERYKSWKPERFAYLKQDQFERYYPAEFADRVGEVLAIKDRRARRNEKRALLEEVLVWLDEDPERAKAALEESAGEVISQLRGIEVELSAGSRVLASD